MGNLMGALRYKEPSTVEECDSTWETDSESDEHPGGEQDSGVSESIGAPESAHCGEDEDGFLQVTVHELYTKTVHNIRLKGNKESPSTAGFITFISDKLGNLALCKSVGDHCYGN